MQAFSQDDSRQLLGEALECRIARIVHLLHSVEGANLHPASYILDCREGRTELDVRSWVLQGLNAKF